ncbi:MAG: hypothetical protein M3O15_09260 [Acidobacteriota bacterium]|nr:hypothetical protein [Acidobacteriota bacterium]
MKRLLKLSAVLLVAAAGLTGTARNAQAFCPKVCIFKCMPGLVCCSVDGCFGCHSAGQCE